MLQTLLILFYFCTLVASWSNPCSPLCTSYAAIKRPSFRLYTMSFRRRTRPIRYNLPTLVMNEDITHREVRLFLPSEEAGEDVMIGIYPIDAALEEARKLETDLILTNEKADPPICRIVDHRKYKYELEKKAKEEFRKERDKKIEFKEVQLSYRIDQHDLEVRLNSIKRFIEAGDRVCEYHLV